MPIRGFYTICCLKSLASTVFESNGNDDMRQDNRDLRNGLCSIPAPIHRREEAGTILRAGPPISKTMGFARGFKWMGGPLLRGVSRIVIRLTERFKLFVGKFDDS